MNSIILELFALSLSLILLIYSVTIRRKLYFPLTESPFKSLRNRHFIFLLLLLTTIISAVFSAAEALGQKYGAKVGTLELIHSFYDFFHNALAPAFALYIIDMLGTSKKRSPGVVLLFFLPLVLCELIIIANPFTHLCFWFNEELEYQRGPLIWVLYGEAALYLLMSLGYFVRSSVSLSKSDRAPLICLVLVACFGIAIQGIWSVRVELFFISIGLLGFVALLEHEDGPSDLYMTNRFRNAVTAVVSLTFLIVIILNVSLTYNLTTVQSNEIGNIQLEIIRSDLQDTISNAEANVLRAALNAQQLLDTQPSPEELEKYLRDQSSNLKTDESFMNIYMAGSDWHIIPDFDAPPEYHAAERVWYIGAKETPGEVYITEPYMDANFGIMCFTVSTLLSDGDTVLAIDLNFSKAQESILRMTGEEGHTAMIVTSGGLIAGYTDMSLVGMRAAEALPDYQDLLQRVTSSVEHNSFRQRLNGRQCVIFSSETSNGWYLILSVETDMLYAETYRQIAMTTSVTLLMLVVVVVFYLVSTRNRMQAAETLRNYEGMIGSLTGRLREATSVILRLSDWRLLSESDDPGDLVGQIKEAGIRLSEETSNLTSYKEMKRAEPETHTKNRLKNRSVAATSRRFRNAIVIVMAFSMAMVLFVRVRTQAQFGILSMQREADSYENQLNEWLLQQEEILSMFTNSIAAKPELMDDYESAVRWLDDVAKKYPEISACYMTNPYAEHIVIMNTGWVPDESFRLETRQWYKDTELSPNGFNISAPYIDAQTGFYCITLSRIVYGENNEFLGIFGIDFFLDKLISVLGQSYSDDGYAFLVDSDRIIINHPNSDYQMSVITSVSIEDTEYAEAYNSKGMTVIKDYAGHRVCCICRQVSSGFSVFVANDWNSIYGSILVVTIAFILMFGFGIVLIVVLINRLIRWQEAANQELVEAAEAAVSAGKAKSQFLAQMSHEIRTPINAVLGMNEMIMNAHPDSEIMEYSANIQSAGRTLLSLINSILDFSKIEDGKMEILSTHYKTLDMIDNLVNMVSERAVKKGLELITEIDPAIPSALYGDDLRIRQVITNILTNAVKYTPSGSITLKMQLLENSAESCVLYVAVTDTGIGIREEDMGKLFDSFLRLDQERNRSIEGTGLGIAIVQRLLTMMDSKLEVESVYGKGSTFSFRLKQQVIDREPIGSYEDHRRQSALKEQGRKVVYAPTASVLVVDDNDLNLKVARGLLRQSGIEPDLADSGRKCLEMTLKKHYDIIFMDHMMPVMDGIQTLEELNKRGGLSDTAIIVLTANAVVGAREEYLKAGFRDYLSKPIEVDALQEILGHYLAADKVEWRILGGKDSETGSQAAADRADASGSADGAGTTDEAGTADGSKGCKAKDPVTQLKEAGLNTEAGLHYAAGDRNFYLELLQGFLKEKDTKTESLKTSLSGHDLKSYEITVHALKSSARTIGADELSALALELETAAKNGEEDQILAKSDELFRRYEETIGIIEGVIGQEAAEDAASDQVGTGDQKGTGTADVAKGAAAGSAAMASPASSVTKEDLLAALNETIEYLDSFEITQASDTLAGLAGQSYEGQSLSEKLSGILKDLDDFEADSAKEKLSELIGQL